VLLDDDALLKAKQFTVFIFITDHEQAQWNLIFSYLSCLIAS
jgi:hypothetical protein